MADTSFDLVVIGGGPGGYVAAIRAAQLGLKVACVEKAAALGGTCLRIGCIPSKAMLEASHRYWETRERLATFGVRVGNVELDLPAMLKRKDEIVRGLTQGVKSLFKKNKIAWIRGAGRFEAPTDVAVDGEHPLVLEAKNTIIATGSQPARLPGVEVDGDRVGTSTEALSYPTVPEHLIVIGGGYIGLEMGSVWRRLGARVTVLEFLDHLLPGMDRQLADEAQRAFKKQGFEFRFGARVTAARANGDKCVVEVADSEPYESDRVLMAVGRTPNTEGLALDKIGLKTDAKGRLEVDGHYATAVPNVYAIGDVIGGAMLAHKAEEEGIACVERLVTGYGHVNYDAIPAVVYTDPEIASVGKIEDELKQAQVDYKRGIFQFRANGRARTLSDVEGFVKVLADGKTDRVLGVHIIGPRAGDLIAEATAAISFGASSEDIARTCHAHPTLSEAVMESALAVDGRAIHA